MMEENQQIIRKGRGHRQSDQQPRDERGEYYETLEERGKGPSKSVEGWIIFVSNIHPEAQEEDILDKFSEFGDVKNIHVNLDRRTGFVKGYALIEFESLEEGSSAIKSFNGKELFGQVVKVDWAFVKK